MMLWVERPKHNSSSPPTLAKKLMVPKSLVRYCTNKFPLAKKMWRIVGRGWRSVVVVDVDALLL
jgi:hypothetical protein